MDRSTRLARLSLAVLGAVLPVSGSIYQSIGTGISCSDSAGFCYGQRDDSAECWRRERCLIGAAR